MKGIQTTNYANYGSNYGSDVENTLLSTKHITNRSKKNMLPQPKKALKI